MIDDVKSFLDSNVWLHSMIEQDETKMFAAKKLIDKLGVKICLSSQIINEVCVNLKRKVAISAPQIQMMIGSFYMNHTVISLNESHLLKASEIRDKASFSFWDSIIVASALSLNAEVLYSEDMQDGFVLDKKLRIVNPFTS